MGQITPEDSMYVRSGNMGNEYACLWLQLDVGRRGGWYAGLTFAATRLFVWRIEERISRWSWRPGHHVPGEEGSKSPHKEYPFIWLMPEIGYELLDGWLDARPSLGLVWPVATGYAWGAPVGAAPMASVDLGIRLGWFRVGAVGRLVFNRASDWVVLQDYSTPKGQPIQKRNHWFVPLEVTVGVAF